jgi:hypothetical protein
MQASKTQKADYWLAAKKIFNQTRRKKSDTIIFSFIVSDPISFQGDGNRREPALKAEFLERCLDVLG